MIERGLEEDLHRNAPSVVPHLFLRKMMMMMMMHDDDDDEDALRK